MEQQINAKEGLMRGYDTRLVSRWRFASMVLDIALIVGVSSLFLYR
jgi:hypothetical protein